MTVIRLCLLVFLFCTCGLAAAQSQPQPIQEQMTAEEFKSAGLDKLSAEELRRLNAWLQGSRVREAKVAEEARRDEATRGQHLLSLGSSEDAFEANLVGAFNGFERGRRYTLDNGQVWQQVDDAKMYGVKLENPRVRLRPAVIGSAWWMQVDGRAVNAKVKRVK